MQDQLQGRLEYLGLDEEARARMEQLQPLLERHLPVALKAFEERGGLIPSSVRFLFGKDQLETGGARQAEQVRAVLGGKADEDSAEGSQRLGHRHARLKLDPRWHVGSYGVMLEIIIRGVVQDVLAEALKPRKNRLGLSAQRDPEAILAEADAMAQGLAGVVKAVLLDVDLVATSHIMRVNEDARAGEERIRARMRRASEATGQTLRLVAGGKFDERFTDAVEPEFEEVRDSANAVADRLAQVLLKLRSTSHSLRSSTGEISASAGDLAGRTLQQAVAIDQANDMIRQLATTLAEMPSGFRRRAN